MLRPEPGPATTGFRFAVDVEQRSQPLPIHLSRSRHFAAEADFWQAWTRFEVCCKLQDVPVAQALSLEPERLAAGVVVRSFDLDDLVISIGVHVALGLGTGPASELQRPG